MVIYLAMTMYIDIKIEDRVGFVFVKTIENLKGDAVPTSREQIDNRALSGAELKQIIKEDFDSLLANEGLLGDSLAYGRIGFEVILRLHLDNPLLRESESRTHSRPASRQAIAADPPRAAIESAPPLKFPSASEDAIVVAPSVSREITSPNAERVARGMPIPVLVEQPDRTRTTEFVTYPREAAGDVPDATFEDKTREARQAWGLLNLVQDVVVPE